MNFLVNGYSPNMCIIPNMNIQQRELTKEQVEKESRGAISYIGHKDFAELLTKEFGREILYNRGNIQLQPENTLYYACINGRRLKEGTTRLPKNSEVRYFRLTFKEPTEAIL